MLRIKPPIAIEPVKADQYCVKCLCDGAEAQYIFTMSESSFVPGERSLSHEKAFFFVTHDDSDAEWLELAVRAFDDATRKGMRLSQAHDAKVQPKSLRLLGPNEAGQFEIELTLQNKNETSEHIITVVESDNFRTATWEHGSCVANLLGGHRFYTADDADPLLVCALRLEQAVNPKSSLYKAI